MVIAEARERTEEFPGKLTQKDNVLAEQLMTALQRQYAAMLAVVSIGCDRGIGKFVREYCIKHEIAFLEYRVKFEGENLPRWFFINGFRSRNPALVDIGDEFHVFVGPNRDGIVESIIPSAIDKVKKERVFVYPCPAELKSWI